MDLFELSMTETLTKALGDRVRSLRYWRDLTRARETEPDDDVFSMAVSQMIGHLAERYPSNLSATSGALAAAFASTRALDINFVKRVYSPMKAAVTQGHEDDGQESASRDVLSPRHLHSIRATMLLFLSPAVRTRIRWRNENAGRYNLPENVSLFRDGMIGAYLAEAPPPRDAVLSTREIRSSALTIPSRSFYIDLCAVLSSIKQMHSPTAGKNEAMHAHGTTAGKNAVGPAEKAVVRFVERYLVPPRDRPIGLGLAEHQMCNTIDFFAEEELFKTLKTYDNVVTYSLRSFVMALATPQAQLMEHLSKGLDSSSFYSNLRSLLLWTDSTMTVAVEHNLALHGLHATAEDLDCLSQAVVAMFTYRVVQEFYSSATPNVPGSCVATGGEDVRCMTFSAAHLVHVVLKGFQLNSRTLYPLIIDDRLDISGKTRCDEFALASSVRDCLCSLLVTLDLRRQICPNKTSLRLAVFMPLSNTDELGRRAELSALHAVTYACELASHITPSLTIHSRVRASQDLKFSANNCIDVFLRCAAVAEQRLVRTSSASSSSSSTSSSSHKAAAQDECPSIEFSLETYNEFVQQSATASRSDTTPEVSASSPTSGEGFHLFRPSCKCEDCNRTRAVRKFCADFERLKSFAVATRKTLQEHGEDFRPDLLQHLEDFYRESNNIGTRAPHTIDAPQLKRASELLAEVEQLLREGGDRKLAEARTRTIASRQEEMNALAAEEERAKRAFEAAARASSLSRARQRYLSEHQKSLQNFLFFACQKSRKQVTDQLRKDFMDRVAELFETLAPMNNNNLPSALRQAKQEAASSLGL